MAVWYRAHLTDNVSEVFSGDGGLYAAGRWNHRGRKAVYCSDSIALCTLEWLAYHGLSVSGFNYYKYSIDIPDHLVARMTSSKLPRNWNFTPATDVTRDFSEQKLFSIDKFLALAVPSVVVPEEYNLVMNPLHAGFARVVKTIDKLGRYTAPER